MKTVILLAAFNGDAHLPALLASLQNQTDPDFTVLMQDDGSEDNTVSVLSAAAERDSRFVFGAEQGARLGAAGNFLSLIRQADADRVLLCDQDDEWEPEKTAVLHSAMTELEKRYGTGTPLMVHSDCSLIDEDGERIKESFFRHQGWDPAAVTLPRLLVQNNVTGCTLMMNRALCTLVADYGRAKELPMHDWFIALTAASFGHIAFVNRPLTRYRQHAGNTIGASSSSLPVRGFAALLEPQKIRRRILLTYTHTRVFQKIYGDRLPSESRSVIESYLATQHMGKLRRILTVRRLDCVMQSGITRLGQILFG